MKKAIVLAMVLLLFTACDIVVRPSDDGGIKNVEVPNNSILGTWHSPITNEMVVFDLEGRGILVLFETENRPNAIGSISFELDDGEGAVFHGNRKVFSFSYKGGDTFICDLMQVYTRVKNNGIYGIWRNGGVYYVFIPDSNKGVLRWNGNLHDFTYTVNGSVVTITVPDLSKTPLLYTYIAGEHTFVDNAGNIFERQ